MEYGLQVIYNAIRTHQGADSCGKATRLIKLSEEVGEVSQAYIGVIAANKRKGHTHTEADVAKELCDVAITALVALHDWTDDPVPELRAAIARVAERCATEGS